MSSYETIMLLKTSSKKSATLIYVVFDGGLALIALFMRCSAGTDRRHSISNVDVRY